MFSIKITAGKKCSLWARCSPVREKCVQEPRNTRSFFLIVPKKNEEWRRGRARPYTNTNTLQDLHRSVRDLSMTVRNLGVVWPIWVSPCIPPWPFPSGPAEFLSDSSFLAYPKEVPPSQEQVPPYNSGATFKLQPERTLKGFLGWYQVRVSLVPF